MTPYFLEIKVAHVLYKLRHSVLVNRSKFTKGLVRSFKPIDELVVKSDEFIKGPMFFNGLEGKHSRPEAY